MDKRVFLGMGLGFFSIMLIGFIVLFLVFGLGGGGNLPNPFNYGTEYICDVVLHKPVYGDTFVESTTCRWGDVCNPPLSFSSLTAKGNVEFLVDGRLMDREQYNIVYGFLPPKDGYETRRLQACLPPGQHDALIDVLDDEGNRVSPPTTWTVTAPEISSTTTTTSGPTTTTTLQPVCSYGRLINPNPPYPSEPLSVSHKIFDTFSSEFCLTGDDDAVWGTIYLVNLGGDMVSPELIEMQLQPKGSPPLFWVSPSQSTCDSSHPENVHKTYMLDFKEELSLNLVSSGLAHDKEYDIYLCSVNKCWVDPPTGNVHVLPYNGCAKVTSITTR